MPRQRRPFQTPPENYLPYLAMGELHLPAVVYRGVKPGGPTLDDFIGQQVVDLDEASSIADRIGLQFGVSVWVSKDRLRQMIIEDELGLDIVQLDLRVATWAKLVPMRRGPSLHFELLGDPDMMSRCVVGEAEAVATTR